MSSYFESGVFNRRGAWHGLGQVWTPENDGDILTPLKALEFSGLDWDVTKEPIYRKGEESGRFWVVRESDDAVLSPQTVGKQYEPIQNTQGFDYLTDLMDESGIEIETAISIYGGRQVTILARKPGHIRIGDDDFDSFIGFTNRHDGLGACKVFTCRERVVCANTQAIAVGEFKRSGRHWSIRHVAGTELKLQEARQALELSFEEDTKFAAQMEEFLAMPLNKDDYKDFIIETVGLREIDKVKEPRKHRSAKAVGYRINDIRRNTPDLAPYKETFYGAFQAVTQFETHEKKYRNEGTKFQNLAVEGGELTNRAFSFLVS